MSLAIIILNWNQPDDTMHCVSICKKWLEPGDHIWVVDNNSTPRVKKQLNEVGEDVSVIFSSRNLGFGGGNNLGIQAAMNAGHEFMLLLNNDASITKTAVSNLITTLKQHPELGMVGPEIWDGDRLLSAGGKDIARTLATHYDEPIPEGELRDVAYVPGTCILMRTAVLQKIGLLDEAYFFGGEVADLCARANQTGYKSAILGGSCVQHQLERSAHQRHQLHIYYILRNRFLFIKKFHSNQKTKLYLYWSRQAVHIWLQAILAGNMPRARAVALACWDGWNGRFGGQNARVTRGAVQ